MDEGTHPPFKSRAYIRNRNNISEMILAKQIKDYEREQSLIILNLDHDRLDMKDFLRQIKKCESDELPESRHWLRRRRAKEQRHLETVRNISTAPATVEPEAVKPEEEVIEPGTFKTKRVQDNGGRPTLYSIFSRRSELVDPGPQWKVEHEEHQDETSRECKVKTVEEWQRSGADCSSEDTSSAACCTASEHPEIRNSAEEASDKSDQLPPPTDGKDKEGDFMKELLVGNATRRFNRKKRRPIEERLVEYYQKLDELKRRQAAEVPSAWEIRRRYVLLTRKTETTIGLNGKQPDQIKSAPPCGRLVRYSSDN